MQRIFILLSFLFSITGMAAQKNILIATQIGKIAVYVNEVPTDKTPIILLHGVYFDHHLWDNVLSKIQDRTVITLDMPLHGKSKQNIAQNWTLDDCANMLIEILDSLHMPKVIAVGHSWGSMTILRAANKQPEKFAAIGLCNMPFQAASQQQKTAFRRQHMMLILRGFYTQQAGKALFGKSSLKENPDLITQLKRPMSLLTNREVKQTDKAVIINAEDATAFIQLLSVKAGALKGEEDYVPTPPNNIKTLIVKGGHVSPLECPKEVVDFIYQLME